ncbi:TPA: 30S ribosomal protein S15 [Candidatus Woesearchaeota archaeon]|nr:30S ribosomal protein S15 [Candidatus Woesearchaeota archaeon]HIH31728.1 30S ribosomal protein S15 [Candidatus Woesearchaeota archaeon]HIH55032.1 30S ribosomal protein S15 [Candidatus Woesearchaeota archaeon]HIJ01040.1 30S ribosomal protein S15 [Candidatus Woesearchaeota archaeon]HIJ14756.1 30S ribosomal protein S15 [Candidatus Woesearchaeota archaeon]
MARKYSGAKGKAGSKKPIKKTVPSWNRYSAKEAEMLILKLQKEGQSPSQIGLHLRDVYGIPDIKVLCGKSITKILDDKKSLNPMPEDLLALIKKLIMIKKHLEENKQDKVALRGMQITESKIQRLIKYYKRTGRLAKDWTYDVSKAKLYV